MVKNREFNDPTIDAQLERTFRFDDSTLLKINNSLSVVANALWFFSQPNKQQKTAMEIPLIRQVGPPARTPNWNKYTSLSLAYQKTDAEERAGLIFMTPQEYDSVQITSLMEDCWELEAFRNEILKTIIGNQELLQLLDSKLAHTPPMINLINKMPNISDRDFTSEMVRALVPLSSKSTDARTYQSNSFSNEEQKKPRATITRAEGLKAVDYSMNIIQPDELTTTFEHGFSIDNNTNETKNIFSRMTVTGPSDTIKQSKRTYDANYYENEGLVALRKIIPMILDKRTVPIIEDFEF